jgi:Cu2+-exporting ATPase
MSTGNKECFHCGLPVPPGTHNKVEIDHQDREMCCAGCQAVAQAIVDNGLTDFYKHRTQNSQKPEDLIPAELQVYDSEELQKTFVRSEDGQIREASLILEGIVCAACVWLNEHHVKQLPGVIDFRINYTTHRASLTWDNSQIKLSDVLQAITAIGYNAHPFDPGRLEAIQKKEKSVALRRIAISAVGMMQVMMLAISLYIGSASDMDANTEKFLRWVSLLLTTPVVLFASSAFFISAWRDLKRRQLGMDVPVSIAILAAYLSSVWATLTGEGEVYFDSVNMFTFFLLVGRYLEMMARHKAGQVAEALVRLLPDSATRVKDDGEHEIIPANELQIDDRILIKPGESIPADGVVYEGESSVNEALLTGESLPLHKQVGNELIGGTVNIESPLVMQVKKLGDSTVLAAIVRLLDQAQSEKPDIAKFADKVAGWFVLVLLLVAVGVFMFWSMNVSNQEAFWITLSVLVVTCPCALSLATPAALTAATGVLTEKGVLTTRGHALETLAKVNHVVFDKTGTLTYGRLDVAEVRQLGDVALQQCHLIAGALESVSEHPVARAIISLSDDNTVKLEQCSAEPGKGISGFYKGKEYRIGNYQYVAELVAEKDFQPVSGMMGTLVYLGSEDAWLASYILQDKIRNEAKQAIHLLQSQGVKTTLLSGDHHAVVQMVASELDMDNAKGDLLPEGKLKYLKDLQEQGDIIAMIGDGVNDAPVLARAQVSLAMGKGSQLAQASADMVLLSENLKHLPEGIQVAKKMQTIIYQNFSWAILYNLSAIPLAALGLIAPWMAAIGMSASSLVVVLNALRLKQ